MSTRTPRKGGVIFLALLFSFAAVANVPAQPTNDHFANRTALSGLPVETPLVSLALATLDAGEPRLPVNTGGQTVWWTWTAPTTGKISVFPASSFRYPAVSFYTGNVLSNLTRVAGGIVPWGGLLPVSVQAGTTYQIQADRGGDSVDNLSLRWEAAPASPANDLFANAIALDGTNLTVQADNTFADVEPGEPQHKPTGSGKTLWWTWMAPANGILTLSTASDAGWFETALYTGDTLSGLTVRGVSTNKFRYPLVLTVRQGEMFRIATDSVDGTYGVFMLNLILVATPSNDFFANRVALTGDHETIDVALGAPGREPGEPTLKRILSPGRTLWWTFAAPADGTLRISANTEGVYNTVSIGAFTGTNLSALLSVAENKDELLLRTKAGATYQIVTGPWYPWTSLLHVSDQFFPAPSNDAFAGRQVLIGPSAYATNDNTAATTEPGEPQSGKTRGAGASLWYTWTAPAAGSLYIVVQGNGMVPVLTVFEGAKLGSLRRVAQSVFSDDTRQPAVVRFATVPGRTYQIEVDGLQQISWMQRGPFELNLEFSTLRLVSPPDGSAYGAAAPPTLAINTPDPAVDGLLLSVSLRLYDESAQQRYNAVVTSPPFSATPLTLAPGRYFAFALATNDAGRALLSPPVSFVVRPAGDNFSTAIPLTGYQPHAAGSLNSATLERSEPHHPGSGVLGSVWYTWTAPQGGPVQIIVSFPESISLDIFSGTNQRALKRVSVQRPNLWTYDFTAIAGVTYDLAVVLRKAFPGSYGEAFSFDLNLRTVTFGSPVAGETFTDLDTVPLSIQTSEPLAGILNVIYRLDGVAVATNQIPPFDAEISRLRPGSHNFTAVAALASSFSVETAPVSIKVLLANDQFTNALALTGTRVTTNAWLYGATQEPGEPLSTFPQKSAWWSWTAPTNGRVWLDYNGTEMPWVKVYTGPSVDALTQADEFMRPGMNISHIELNVVAGTNYHIALLSAVECAGTLDLTLLQPPANDQFANRILVEGTNILLQSSLVEATEEPGEPVMLYGCGYTGRSVWWSWTAPTNGIVSIVAPLSNYCLRMGVYTGNVLTNLNRVGYGEDGAVTFEAQAGQTYQIVFDSSQEYVSVSALLTFTPTPDNQPVVAPSGSQIMAAPVDAVLPAAPTLEISTQGKIVRISWPAEFGGQLESTPSLGSDSDWQRVAAEARVEGARKVVEVPLDSPQRYFRLR